MGSRAWAAFVAWSRVTLGAGQPEVIPIRAES